MMRTLNNKCKVCSLIALIIILAGLLFYAKKKCSKKEKFDSHAKQSLLFFKAGWCGHCNRFKPVWDEFVNECHQSGKYPSLDLREIDVDEESSKPLMEKHNVKGFPHVVLVDETNNVDTVFQKNRTKEDLLAFIQEKM